MNENKIRGLFFIPDHLREEIEGDLWQRFERDVRRYGSRIAKFKLTLNIIKFFRPGIIFRNKKSSPRPTMIRNYFKIAFRSILKQKSYSLLNIVGLSLGMAASLLILQYVKYERSFDTFHENAKYIYRVQYNVYHQGVLNFESAVAVPAIAGFLKKNFPEVEETSRLYPVTDVVTYESPTRGTVTFQEKKMQYAAPEVLKMFSFDVIKGNRETCLQGIDHAIISERAAKKYFGDEDPIGKRLRIGRDSNFEITGVFEDVPQNSHIRFDFLLSYATLNHQTNDASENVWGWYDFYTFVKVRPGTNIEELQLKIDQQLEKERGASWVEIDGKQEFILRPLLDIHLKSKLLYEPEPEEQRDADSIFALGTIAFFILAIAWINYINLATARSLIRANEVGVRKVMGAFRSQLINQFLMESFIMNVIGCILALIFVRAGWYWFSNLTGWNLPISYLNQPEFWLLVGGLFLLGTALSGFYPAIVLSSFKPVAVLKGKLLKSSGGEILRKSLVVFQFSTSIILIVGSMVVYSQVKYMKRQDLGVSLDETLILQGPNVIDSTYAFKYESFKNEIIRIPGVKSISAATMVPGDEIYWTMNIRKLIDPVAQNLVVSSARVDADYIPSFGIKLLAGRNFDRQRPNDIKRVIINEALSKGLKFKEPKDAIDQKVLYGRDTFEIAGVVEDYHQMSLKSAVAPLGILYGTPPNYFSIKVESENYSLVTGAISEHWNTFFQGNPVNYFFLDEFFNRQYDKDNRFGQVFTLFTFLGILIASLGLFGLASFMALQRTKEIGIRKVLGSSVSGIVMLLFRSFMQPVLIANLIAWPIAWWIMDRWLQSFPYRISINPIYFIGAGVIVVIIAFVSVSSQTLKAAMTKPADTLKHE
jgi:putative ABC transport system permease protein